MAAAERRQFERIEKVLEIRYWINHLQVSARVSGISEDGLFIDTRNPLGPGTVLTLSFQLSDELSDTPILGTGKVIWTEPMMGMGVQFLDLSQEDCDRIRQLIQDELATAQRSP